MNKKYGIYIKYICKAFGVTTEEKEEDSFLFNELGIKIGDIVEYTDSIKGMIIVRTNKMEANVYKEQFIKVPPKDLELVRLLFTKNEKN